MKNIVGLVFGILAALFIYLGAWPVPTDPIAWTAPQNPGYIGVFAPNSKLAGIERVSLGGLTGPEDIAIGPDGLVYAATHEGKIVRYNPTSNTLEEFADTTGRPLGIEFDQNGSLFAADAYLGLLKIGPEGQIIKLADVTESGSPIRYADDLDIAPDGAVYFTDASTKFGAKENGGTFPASLLDLMEHGGHGRVLKFDPASEKTSVFLDGLNFANGLAITADGQHLLVVETGSYSILKVPLTEPGKATKIVDNLPGFPDNINRNKDGTFWLGLVSPRSEIVDNLSRNPFMRKVIQRLPEFMRPTARRYGFVVKIDENGTILETLQDPTGAYALTTGMVLSDTGVGYVSSLTEPDIGMLK